MFQKSVGDKYQTQIHFALLYRNIYILILKGLASVTLLKILQSYFLSLANKQYKMLINVIIVFFHSDLNDN